MKLIRWPFRRAGTMQPDIKQMPLSGASVSRDEAHIQQYGINPSRPQMFACNLGSDSPVALISRHPEKLDQEIEWLSDQSLPVLVTHSLANIARQGFGGHCPFSMLVVDVDTLGDLEDVTDDLARLRRDNADLPVILISSGFAQDDFSCVRLPIADVSLRWPVSFFRLEIAVSQAQANNLEWQSRGNSAGPCGLQL